MNPNNLYFGPGPSILPTSVREAIKNSLWDDPDLPCSVLECSHQFPALKNRLSEIRNHFRLCLDIPEDFEIVFMPGGARLHYGLVACNILQTASSAAALITGYWSDIAFQEQNRLCQGRVQPFQLFPSDDNVSIDLSSYDFVHGVTNETVSGICIPDDQVSHPGLIMDMTSDLGYRLVDWSRYALVYAGLQKAFGLAGMSVVIIKRSLLSVCSSHLPTLQNYASIASSQSLAATPNIAAWWVLGHMLNWIDEQGGVKLLGLRQKRRATRFYDLLSRCSGISFEQNKPWRSTQNIVFQFKDSRLMDSFLLNAEQEGFVGLRNHKSRQGIRLNLYHGVSDEMTEKLYTFLEYQLSKQGVLYG